MADNESRDNEATRVAPRAQDEVSNEEVPTRLLRRSSDKTKVFKRASDGETRVLRQSTERLSSPVVGWLIVVSGSSRGQTVELHSGDNTVVQHPELEDLITLKQDQESSNVLGTVSYDPTIRQFTIDSVLSGPAPSLNGAEVTLPLQLSDGDSIRLGSTDVRFKALCGPEFDWSDLSD